jgi:hypothetical protein
MSEGLSQQLLDEAPKAFLAALIPAFQMLWKWLKNRDAQAKRSALRTRIAELANQKESLAKVQQLPQGNQLVRDVEAELELSISELANLGAVKPFRKPADRPLLARWFLLFVPTGILPWIVHTLFFLNLAVVIFGLFGVLTDWDQDGMYGLLGLAIFTIPAIVFRAIAIKIANSRPVHQNIA